MLQLSLPQKYLANINEIVGVDIIPHYFLIDITFVISATISFVIIYINFRNKKRKYASYGKAKA